MGIFLIVQISRFWNFKIEVFFDFSIFDFIIWKFKNLKFMSIAIFISWNRKNYMRPQKCDSSFIDHYIYHAGWSKVGMERGEWWGEGPRTWANYIDLTKKHMLWMCWTIPSAALPAQTTSKQQSRRTAQGKSRGGGARQDLRKRPK